MLLLLGGRVLQQTTYTELIDCHQYWFIVGNGDYNLYEIEILSDGGDDSEDPLT